MPNENHPVAVSSRSLACDLYHRADEIDGRLGFLIEELTRLTTMLDKRVFDRPSEVEPPKAPGNPDRQGILADLDAMTRSHNRKLDTAFALLHDITNLVE